MVYIGLLHKVVNTLRVRDRRAEVLAITGERDRKVVAGDNVRGEGVVIAEVCLVARGQVEDVERVGLQERGAAATGRGRETVGGGGRRRREGGRGRGRGRDGGGGERGRRG